MATGIWNGKVVANPSAIYDELVNRDIAEQPHKNKTDADGFFYKTREAYRPIGQMLGISGQEKRRVTDVYVEDSSGCEEGDCFNYYYLVNRSRTQYAVLARMCGDCDAIAIDKGDRCPCASDKFFDILSPDHDLSSFAQNEIYNDATYGWINTDIDTGLIPGSYITIVGLEAGSQGVCGQTRQVLNITRVSGQEYNYNIQLSQPWTGLVSDTKYDGINISVSENVSLNAGYVTSQGIKYLSKSLANSFAYCDFGSCIQSAVTYNGTLVYLNDKGYSFYGGVGFDSNSVSATNSFNVGKDMIDLVAFNNFIVYFGNNSISAQVFSEDGTTSFYYRLRDDIGIKNKGAYALFDNGLFFVGNDNRVYGASISSIGGGQFSLVLEDITQNVVDHMNVIQDNDEVYLGSYANRLYIFINGRDYDANKAPNKTKILIYDKTYGQWLVHTLCGEVISGIKYGQFLGESIYSYCGYGGDGLSRRSYECLAQAVIFDNSNTGQQSNDSLPLDMFRRHRPTKAVILLGMGDYSSDNTYIKMEKNDRYKYTRVYNIDDTHEIIENRHDAYNGNRIEPSECFISSLGKCDNYHNPCEGSHKNSDIVDTNFCGGNCDKKRVFEDYCICYDDKGYALSPIAKFAMEFDETMGDLFKVSFISNSNDIAYFGGMLIKVESENDMFDSENSFTSDCCSPIKNCPKSSC